MITRADINFVKSLSKKRHRSESGMFVIEGPKLLEELLEAGVLPHKIYATEEHSDIRNSLAVTSKEIERMSSLRSPQGVLAVVPIPEHRLPERVGQRLTLVLDGVQDPGNLGTIIRIADWFGIENILCSPDTADCFNPKVVQATMGAIFRVRVHYVDLQQVVSRAVGEGVPVYGTFLEGENIYSTTLKDEGLVVLGSEGAGVSSELETLVSKKLHIPPFPVDKPSVESLNVAVATAIICSEFRRR